MTGSTPLRFNPGPFYPTDDAALQGMGAVTQALKKKENKKKKSPEKIMSATPGLSNNSALMNVTPPSKPKKKKTTTDSAYSSPQQPTPRTQANQENSAENLSPRDDVPSTPKQTITVSSAVAAANQPAVNYSPTVGGRRYADIAKNKGWPLISSAISDGMSMRAPPSPANKIEKTPKKPATYDQVLTPVPKPEKIVPITTERDCLIPHIQRVEGHAKENMLWELSDALVVKQGEDIKVNTLKAIEQWRAKRTPVTKEAYAAVVEQPRTFFGKLDSERAQSAQCIDQIWLRAASPSETEQTRLQDQDAIALALKELRNYITSHQADKSAAAKVIALQSLVTKILISPKGIDISGAELQQIVKDWKTETPLLGNELSNHSLMNRHRNSLSAFFNQETTSMALIKKLEEASTQAKPGMRRADPWMMPEDCSAI